ncbi:glycosyltransferase family 2 protein [bacterium]|nr:glycosyltransferase family 2 protein [bacterium]
MNKKVSIIIPVFNTNPKYIQEAIDSALNQTYKNIEIIVVNDGSKNKETLEYLNNYKNENVKIIHQENMGISTARNTGIEKAQGEYILPLDSDDIIDSTYIEKAQKILTENEKIGIVYSKAELFGIKKKEWKLPKYNKEDFIFKNCIFSSALFRKSTWEKVDKYKNELSIGLEDWDFWLSILELGYEPYQIQETLFYYRKHSDTSLISSIEKNLDTARKIILNNHLDLYLENDETVKRIFLSKNSKGLNKIYEKLRKYKKLFNYCLVLNIITLIVLALVIIFSF